MLKFYNEAKEIVKYFGFDFTKKEFSKMDSDGNYITKQEFPVDSRIRSHLGKRYSLCLTRFSHTKVYVIDLDNHNDYNMRKTKLVLEILEKLLGKPTFIERSKKSMGYHIYYKFNKYITQVTWSNFEKWFFEKYNYKIETLTGNKKLKIPFSEYYQIYGEYNPKITDNYIEKRTINECIELMKLPGVDLPEILRNKEVIFYHLKDFREYPTKEKDIVQSKSADFRYGLGERNNTQFKIALRAISAGKTFSEYVDECYLLDVGSKDMRDWKKSAIMKELESKWRDAGKIATSKITNSSAADGVYIVGMENVISKSDEDELWGRFYSLSDMKEGKIKDSFVKNCILFYKFCLSSINYRKERNFKYLGNFSFLNKENVVPLGKELRIKVCKKLRIRNYRKIYKFFVKHSIIAAVKNEKGYTYGYHAKRWVQHFVISMPEKILEKLKKVVEKIKYVFENIFDNIPLKSLLYYESIKNQIIRETG